MIKSLLSYVCHVPVVLGHLWFYEFSKESRRIPIKMNLPFRVYSMQGNKFVKIVWIAFSTTPFHRIPNER